MGVKIAIYGGIGSGKSSVSRIIEDMGYTVLDCDSIYRQEVLTDEAFKSLLIDKFGGAIINGGSIDTRALGVIVYSVDALRHWLDAIAHPLILQKLNDKMKGKDIVFAEVPLLYECGWKDKFDASILVACDLDVRIARLTALRYKKEGEEYVRKVIAAQTSEEKLKEIADYVIDNCGGEPALAINTYKVLQKIKKDFHIN